MSTKAVRNEELYYDQNGSGPSILLVHAGVADSRMWQSQVEYFSRDYRVTRCDLRGFGRSYLPDQSFSHHGDLAQLVETLDLGPTWVVGASYGGQVAIDLALSRPELVQGLVLVSPAVSGFEPVDEVRRFVELEDELLEEEELEDATELNVRMWVDGPYRDGKEVDQSIRDFVGEMQMLAFSHPEPDGVTLEQLDPPALGRLSEIAVPTLIITGELDVPEFVELGETVVRSIPGSERIVMPRAAHMLSLEFPDAFNGHVKDFLRRHGM